MNFVVSKFISNAILLPFEVTTTLLHVAHTPKSVKEKDQEGYFEYNPNDPSTFPPWQISLQTVDLPGVLGGLVRHRLESILSLWKGFGLSWLVDIIEAILQEAILQGTDSIFISKVVTGLLLTPLELLKTRSFITPVGESISLSGLFEPKIWLQDLREALNNCL